VWLSDNNACSKWSQASRELGRRLLIWLTPVLFCSVAVLRMVQAGPQNRTLVLAGHQGELPVVEMGGRFYVEIEALTRLANGSLSFRGSQIVVTLPLPRTNTQTNHLETGQSATSGFSRDFLKAAIEEMAVIREWRSTLTNAVRQGFPVTEDWVTSFHAQAQKNLRLVSLAAATESDRNALNLVTNELNNMKKLSDRFVEANKSRTYIATDALANDPLDQRILNCAHSLATMAANDEFVDDGSCH
jgi:hypothetical protein